MGSAPAASERLPDIRERRPILGTDRLRGEIDLWPSNTHSFNELPAQRGAIPSVRSPVEHTRVGGHSGRGRGAAGALCVAASAAPWSRCSASAPPRGRPTAPSRQAPNCEGGQHQIDDATLSYPPACHLFGCVGSAGGACAVLFDVDALRIHFQQACHSGREWVRARGWEGSADYCGHRRARVQQTKPTDAASSSAT